MANSKHPALIVNSIRGGMNDQDPSHSIPDDQCVEIKNVEFFFSTLGERRRGCTPVDITASTLDTEYVIVHLGLHYPLLAEVFEAQLWAVGATDGVTVTFAYRDSTGTWAPVVPVNTPVNTFPIALRMQSQTLHGKMFFAFKSNADRLNVFDGTVFRAAGIKAPTFPPTVLTSGNPGTYSLDRIFRIRYIEKQGSVIVRRSEPSPEVTFTPPGTDDGAIVTRPALVNEGETHWELEASDGDGNFYIIATTPIATLSYTDTIEPATDYATFGVLSADIGDYDLIPSVKYVKADQDRLIVAGHWTDPEKGSRVAWTPVWADPGVGNDERIPARLDNFIDLDWMDGGELTGISDPVNGVFYAFKWDRIYKLQRTGRFDKAYDAFLLSSFRGAIYGSIISGTDEFGRGCIYFLDPSIGPMRVGAQGLQHIQNIRGTWRHVNTRATNTICHGVYYPDKLQVHWWLATDGTDTPNKKIVLQVNEQRTSQVEGGTERGWAIADGHLAEAWCSTVFPEEILDEDSGANLLSFRPYIGLPTPDFIQRCDVGSTDAGHGYRARILSKPFIVAGLLNRFGVMTAALLASPNPDPRTHINVKFIRDFGIENNLTTTNFVPETVEDQVIKVFDNLSLSGARAIQIEFSDP